MTIIKKWLITFTVVLLFGSLNFTIHAQITDPAIARFYGIKVSDSLKLTILDAQNLKMEMIRANWTEGTYVSHFEYQISNWITSSPTDLHISNGYTRGYRLTGRVVYTNNWPWIDFQQNYTPDIFVYIHDDGQRLTFSGGDNRWTGWVFIPFNENTRR